MAKIKLTKSTAAAAEPRASTYILFDSDLPGFGLRVTPAGAKSWVAEYRAKGGGRRAPTRRITIGSIALFNAEHARSAAKDILASVRLGADPAEERKLNREAATIAELAAEFIKPTAKVTRKQSTLDLLEIYFRKHINPAIGSKRAQDVTHDDVVRLHRKLGATHPATANRIVMALSGLFSWAIAKQKIRRADNPAKNIDRFIEKSRERFLSTEELARLTVMPFNIDATDHDEGASFASHEVVGAHPSLEFVGEVQESWRVRGSIFPKKFGGLSEIDALHAMRRSGAAQFWMRGDGVPMSLVVIERVCCV